MACYHRQIECARAVAAVAFAVLSLAAVATASAKATFSSDNTLCRVEVEQGVIEGDIFTPYPTCTYKGIPFAKPP